MHQPTLPLPDRAGRGAIEKRIQLLVRDMTTAAHTDRHEFERLSRLLDIERKKFHKLYGVKEHPTLSPLRTT